MRHRVGDEREDNAENRVGDRSYLVGGESYADPAATDNDKDTDVDKNDGAQDDDHKDGDDGNNTKPCGC